MDAAKRDIRTLVCLAVSEMAFLINVEFHKRHLTSSRDTNDPVPFHKAMCDSERHRLRHFIDWVKDRRFSGAVFDDIFGRTSIGKSSGSSEVPRV
jgi:hypothetical protein